MFGTQQPKESIVLKAGTLVKVGGFPFKLLQDTPVEGHQANLALNLQGPAVAGPGLQQQKYGDFPG